MLLVRALALILISALSLDFSSAFAASYQQIDGTIVDPIPYRNLGDHPCSGVDLVPGVSAPGAWLFHADLSGVELTNAHLTGEDLGLADLTEAHLGDEILFSANLANAVGLSTTFGSASPVLGSAFYAISADYHRHRLRPGRRRLDARPRTQHRAPDGPRSSWAGEQAAVGGLHSPHFGMRQPRFTLFLFSLTDATYVQIS